MRKQTEGDNQRRRAAARDARRHGDAPSERGVTTGASKQRRHLGNEAEHDEKIAGPGWGKQDPQRYAAGPRPGSVPSTAAPRASSPPRSPAPSSRPGELSGTAARAFEAIATVETRDGAAVSAQAIASAASLDVSDLERALDELVRVHDVVIELPVDDGDGLGGPVYRIKARV